MARTRMPQPDNDRPARMPEAIRQDGEPVRQEVQDPGLAAAFTLLTELPPEIDRRDDPQPQARASL